jgi:hypothetical protein
MIEMLSNHSSIATCLYVVKTYGEGITDPRRKNFYLEEIEPTVSAMPKPFSMNFLKLAPYTLAGFDLTTHCFSVAGGDDATRPRHQGIFLQCIV